MTERIAVGDLVEVVRPRLCCPERSRLGGFFTVTKIMANDLLECCYCGKFRNVPHVELSAYPNRGIETCRLRRIPPLSELESSKTDEPLKEPA